MVTENERGLSDTPDDGLEMLWRLPKVELHLHLEGAIRPATVCAQARRYEPGSPFCHDGWHADFWSFGDLTGFVADLRQVVRTALRSADDYYLVARECFEDLAAQQVVYAEVSFEQRPPDRPHYVSLPDTLAAIEQARCEVEARTPLRVGLILWLGRRLDDASASALACQWVEQAVAARDRGAAVVGVDLHGDEQTFPSPQPFVAAFRLAAHPIRALHEAGVRVTVSSDDPLPFATTVTEELAHLHRDLGFSLPDLGRFMVTAAAHSFQPAPARSTLIRTLQDAWPG